MYLNKFNFMTKITTVIAAGGLGTRLIGYKGNDSTKMLLKIKNSSMIFHQVNRLISSTFICYPAADMTPAHKGNS